MNKLLIAAAILAATAAQAGYYDRVPNGSDYHYTPSPEEREQAYRQQQLQMQYETEREIHRLRQSMPRCTEFALPNGRLASHCE